MTLAWDPLDPWTVATAAAAVALALFFLVDKLR